MEVAEIVVQQCATVECPKMESCSHGLQIDKKPAAGIGFFCVNTVWAYVLSWQIDSNISALDLADKTLGWGIRKSVWTSSLSTKILETRLWTVRKSCRRTFSESLLGRHRQSSRHEQGTVYPSFNPSVKALHRWGVQVVIPTLHPLGSKRSQLRIFFRKETSPRLHKCYLGLRSLTFRSKLCFIEIHSPIAIRSPDPFIHKEVCHTLDGQEWPRHRQRLLSGHPRFGTRSNLPLASAFFAAEATNPSSQQASWKICHADQDPATSVRAADSEIPSFNLPCPTPSRASKCLLSLVVHSSTAVQNLLLRIL